MATKLVRVQGYVSQETYDALVDMSARDRITVSRSVALAIGHMLDRYYWQEHPVKTIANEKLLKELEAKAAERADADLLL